MNKRVIGGKVRKADRYYDSICDSIMKVLWTQVQIKLRRETYNFVLGLPSYFLGLLIQQMLMSTYYALAAVLDKSGACVLRAEIETKL